VILNHLELTFQNDETKVKLLNQIRSVLANSIFSLPFSKETLESVVGSSLNQEWEREIGVKDVVYRCVAPPNLDFQLSGLKDCSACAVHVREVMTYTSKVITDSRKEIDTIGNHTV
jgi:hypothetical protein